MHYKFPVIEHIDHVLPYVKDREEFLVAEREGFTVINYMVSMPDTFYMEGVDDLGGAIRRECRGIIFDRNGKLISRPYHKFFNIGERDETQPYVIDLSRKHVIMEKMDGSMIRPLWINHLLGGTRLATKMGITDVAMNAEVWLVKQPDVLAKMEWIREWYREYTPLFEWVSKSNQIVIDYAEEDLVLTGIRHTITGEYLSLENIDTPFKIVPMYGSFSKYLSR